MHWPWTQAITTRKTTQHSALFQWIFPSHNNNTTNNSIKRKALNTRSLLAVLLALFIRAHGSRAATDELKSSIRDIGSSMAVIKTPVQPSRHAENNGWQLITNDESSSKVSKTSKEPKKMNDSVNLKTILSAEISIVEPIKYLVRCAAIELIVINVVFKQAKKLS